MNVKALNKIESAYVLLDWREWLVGRTLTAVELNALVNVVAVFRGNRSAKQVVIAKLKYIPAYVVLEKPDYSEFLDWICDVCTERELYETCTNIMKIKEKLCSTSKK